MPCLLLFIVLFFPRLVLVVMAILGTTRPYFTMAFPSYPLVLSVLGFFLMPLTTVVYVWMAGHHELLQGINLVWLLLAVIIDVSGWGGGIRRRRPKIRV